ncbi:helix-turn-helix domain-containing protein [Micrococcus luteus]|uniref:helix-turn-helix domain-containing protein n=1 Tax=Micrococcus luteus TaxID=1270 RepID=UPI0011AA5AFF|nr:helix-turn-helix domain-containing protein [Micrococcus luteus]
MPTSAPSAVVADPRLPSPEAARYLGLSPRTLINWRNQGKGPCFQRDGAPKSPVYYRLSDLNAWLDGQVARGGEAA